MTRFLLALSAFTLAAATVSAQSVPSSDAFPSACQSQCANTVETSVLCTQQYSSSLDVGACFCAALPSDLSSCASCVSSNGAADLGTSLSDASTQCPTATKACAFQCGSVPQCSSTDVACQCSSSFLQAVLDCASCNDANGNTGQTSSSDYKALADSCAANSYTNTPTATRAAPSPTGQGAYVAPTGAVSYTGTATVGAQTTGAAVTGGAGGESAAVGTVPGTSQASVATGGGVVAPQTLSLARSSSAAASASRASGSVSARSSASAGASQVGATGGAKERFGVAGALGAVVLGAVVMVL